MFIISPKWIYFSNNKVESGKSLLIDGSIITAVLTENKIEKEFKEIHRIYYKEHLLMPTFSECFIDVSDCATQELYLKKLKNLLNNGVTKVQVVLDDYTNILKYESQPNMNISYKLTIDGSKCRLNDITKILNILDFYKSDCTKRFSINLKNINHFKKELLIKISSICTELNLSIDVHLNELAELSNKHISETFNFWEEINLTNNFVVHDYLQSTKLIQKNISKINTTIVVKYSDLLNVESIIFFLSLMKNKYKCILVSEHINTYKFYDVLKTINLLFDSGDSFDGYKIINSVTSYASQYFIETSRSENIEHGSLASFNLFNIQSKRLLPEEEGLPLLGELDNTSLTAVWSSGEAIKIKNE